MSDKSKRKRRAGDLDPDPEMWAALDDGLKLRAILEDFYTRVYADPRLKHFFLNVTRERAIDKQYEFLRDKFLGTRDYFGDRPRNAHHWMVISDELFDYREGLIAQCARDAGLEEKWVARLRALNECFRKQIVKSAPIPKKVRGVSLPLDGYGDLVLAVGSLCDHCGSAADAGESVKYHLRTGEVYCLTCFPEVSA